MLLRAARDATQNHARLEEQATLDRECAPAPEQPHVLVQPLGEDHVDGGCRVLSEASNVGQDGVAEAVSLRLVVDGQPELVVLPPSFSDVDGTDVALAEQACVLDGAPGGVVEAAGEHPDHEPVGHPALRPTLGRHRGYICHDHARLDEKTQLEAELRTLRRGQQRPLAELLREHHRDDLALVLAHARDRGRARRSSGRCRVASRRAEAHLRSGRTSER